jgi:uncharacterized protein
MQLSSWLSEMWRSARGRRWWWNHAMTGEEPLPDWVRDVVPEGLVDLHTHFLPEQVLNKVWAYFDDAGRHYGLAWPVHYRLPEDERLAALRRLGVTTFAPLVYPHRPGMAAWLNDWVVDFADRTPGAVRTATIYPDPDVVTYTTRAVERGVRAVKVHVQVGGFDPRDELLDPVWGLLADAALPVVVHCGDGPIAGAWTGIDVFEQVLRRHPRLVAVLAHAGMPDYDGALGLVARYPGVHLDTTMVGTAFTEAFAPLPVDWTARLAAVADRVVLGTDFPNIPYAYAEQVEAIGRWAQDERLGAPFLRAVLRETSLRLLAA